MVTVLTVALAVLYLEGAWRVARRHPARPWPWWRTGMFLGGLAVVVLATESGIGAYDDVLVWDHMIQHLMLIMVAPAMLVTGQPVTLLLHASRNPLHTWAKRAVRSRVVTWLTWPPVGVIAYAVTIIGTHLTRLMSLVMTNPALHAAEHALYLVVGYLFFLPLLGREPVRWRISYPVRLFVLFLAMPVDTFTGLALGYSTTPMRRHGPAACLGAQRAQRPALGGRGDVGRRRRDHVRADDGGVPGLEPGWPDLGQRPRMAGIRAPGELRRADRIRPGARDRRYRCGPGRRRAEATIDDDEHLAAYNAYLARINAAEPPGPGRSTG